MSEPGAVATGFLSADSMPTSPTSQNPAIHLPVRIIHNLPPGPHFPPSKDTACSLFRPTGSRPISSIRPRGIRRVALALNAFKAASGFRAPMETTLWAWFVLTFIASKSHARMRMADRRFDCVSASSIQQNRFALLERLHEAFPCRRVRDTWSTVDVIAPIDGPAKVAVQPSVIGSEGYQIRKRDVRVIPHWRIITGQESGRYRSRF